MPLKKLFIFSMLLLCLIPMAQTISQTDGDRAFSAVPASQKSEGQTFVLLVGINAYPPTINPLRYCGNDMETLAASFEKAGIPRENIIVMTDHAEKTELRPSKSNIERQLKTMTQKATENDLFIFAFSGHGAGFGRESFLCPNDSSPSKLETLISRRWVDETIENCAAKRKLFLVDACRNDLLAPGNRSSLTGARSMIMGDELSRGFAILASCSTGQQSWEDETIGHGVFTYYIIQGIEGAADENHDGVITLNELYSYAMKETRTHVLNLKNKIQVPTRGGETSGDFAIVKISTLGNTSVDSNMVLPENTNTTHPASVDDRWESIIRSGMEAKENKDSIAKAINNCTPYPVKDGGKIIISVSGVRAKDPIFNHLSKAINKIFLEQLKFVFQEDEDIIVIRSDSNEIDTFTTPDYRTITLEGEYNLMERNQNGMVPFVDHKYFQTKDTGEIKVLVSSELHLTLRFEHTPWGGGPADVRRRGVCTIKFKLDGEGVNNGVPVIDDPPSIPVEPVFVVDDSDRMVEPPQVEKEYDLDVILCDNDGNPLKESDGHNILLAKFSYRDREFVAFENGQKFKLLLTNKTDEPVIATVSMDNMGVNAFCEDVSLAKNKLYFDVKANGIRVVEGWFISRTESKVFEIKPFGGGQSDGDELDSFSGIIVAEFHTAEDQLSPQFKGGGLSSRKIEVAEPDANSARTKTTYKISTWYNPVSKGTVGLRYCDKAQEEEIQSLSL